MKIDVKIIEVGKSTVDKINKGHIEQYKLKARDAQGTNVIQITSASAFDGFKTNQLITIDVVNCQTSIKDFEDQEQKLKDDKKAEKKVEKEKADKK